MDIHYFQHVPFEGLGHIKTWVDKHGHQISRTPFYKDNTIPDPDQIDLLIIMGGPMSVNDEQTYPWIKQEKRFIQKMLTRNKPILGICLGAQLIASALNSNVYPNTYKEIGWYSVQFDTTKSKTTNLDLPNKATLFHWHGETFDLPQNAIRIASTPECINQAFLYKNNVLGLQFHPETTPDSLRQILDNCRDELTDDQYIMSEEDMLTADENHYKTIHTLTDNLLDFLASSVQ